jgi:Xaa-Pro dipeptidase
MLGSRPLLTRTRQRRYFFYLTGCPLSDCHLIYDMRTSKSTLFIPPVDPDSVIWSGLPVSAEEAKEKWDVDEVEYVTQVNAALARFGASSSDVPKTTIFAIPEQISEQISFLEFDNKNLDILKEAIEVARVVKSDYELALIGKANEISTDAHTAVLKHVKKVKNERELEAVFLGTCIAGGARNQAYHSIVASGRAAATLHYVANNAPMENKLNLLLDAGAEWDCYCSDVVGNPPNLHSLSSR